MTPDPVTIAEGLPWIIASWSLLAACVAAKIVRRRK